MGPLPSVTAIHPGRVPRGAPSRVPYVARSDIVFPDGRRTVLQRPPPQSASDVSGEAYATVARMRAGWLEPRIVPFLAGRPLHGGPEPVLVAD